MANLKPFSILLQDIIRSIEFNEVHVMVDEKALFLIISNEKVKFPLLENLIYKPMHNGTLLAIWE